MSKQERMGKARASIVLVCLILSLTHQIHADHAHNPQIHAGHNTTHHAQSGPQDFVRAHNAARAAVGVPPLVWNDTLAAYAQAYAQQRSKDCAMQHSQGEYGENLAAGTWDMSAQDAVNMWLDEKPKYDIGSNTCIGGGYDCLHYTQVVWGGTARVGCARARCSNGWTFVICDYDPPGNYIGERPF